MDFTIDLNARLVVMKPWGGDCGWLAGGARCRSGQGGVKAAMRNSTVPVLGVENLSVGYGKAEVLHDTGAKT
jgi:hypothetical protein